MPNIDLKVGYSCNDACIHCVVDDFRDSLRDKHCRQDKTFEEIADEMRAARKRGDTLVITGGEPTIRADFWQITALAKELGYRILLQSNGRRFSDMEFARNIKGYEGCFDFCIAMHGPTADIHDKVTQRPGSFAETIQGLKNINALGFRVSGKIVLSKFNFFCQKAICEKFVEVGVSHIDIAFPHAQGRAAKLWEQVVPSYKESAPYAMEAADYLQSRGVSVSFESFPFCTVPNHEHLVGERWQQAAEYAEINQYGSDMGIANWSKLRLEIKQKFAKCDACRFNLICEGPWNEYACRCGGEEFHPVYGRRINDVREVLPRRSEREFAAAAKWV